MKDYYKILEVSNTASPDDIKRAFKKLAKKYHPDANPDNARAEGKFKEISEAYEVLGNEASRQDYDRQKEDEKFTGFSRMRGFSTGSPFGSSPFDDILRHFSDGSPRTGGNDFPHGFSDFFQKSRPRSAAVLKVPLKIAAGGGKIQVTGMPGGPQMVTIPENCASGVEISVQTPTGPFYLEVAIEDDPPFYLKGNVVETTITINLAQAVLGGNVKFRDLKDSEITLKIPPGSQPGDILRLRQQGLSKGDLHVRLTVRIPKDLSEQEKELFSNFAVHLGLIY